MRRHRGASHRIAHCAWATGNSIAKRVQHNCDNDCDGGETTGKGRKQAATRADLLLFLLGIGVLGEGDELLLLLGLTSSAANHGGYVGYG